MSNSSSPSKSPFSQEIENPSHSIPPPEGSPSTPVCRLSVVKPTPETPTEDIEFVSQRGPVSSTMSERLFEGDLPKGKGMESNLLASAEELVVVQSLASLKRDIQPTHLEQECKSPKQATHGVQPVYDKTPETMGVTSKEEDEEETPLVWSRKGVRGAYASTVDIRYFGVTEVKGKEKGKGRGKWWNLPPKETKRRYTTRGVVQKFLRDALVENEVHTERNQRQIRLLRMPTEEPTAVPQNIGSSETKTKDIVQPLVKWKKEAEK
ncbi:hypothetical protein H5410_002278 [Solanum commersonii]|uniref:Uncharacterized protein n=1 Tax=Solanum commersonii TaxID=4109 RepID=A0A9J6B1I4_SOLCO|nr:hypothetical protein H5410_002278 [Solanum commersonii]